MDWPSAPDKEMRALREGTNGWTCMPGPPEAPRYSPMCNDQTMMQWMMAMRAGKKPNIDRIGISYMLQEEAGSDVQDINAKTPPPGQDWYYAGPTRHARPTRWRQGRIEGRGPAYFERQAIC